MAHVDVTSTFHPVPVQMNRCAAELLTITTRTTPSGAAVVAARGEVEMTTSRLLRDRVAEQLRSTHHLVLDLGGVSFLCAAGLTVLVEIRERALVTGTSLCVVARTREVRLPLMITGLTSVLDLHVDVDEALSCVSGRAPSSPARSRLADPRQPGDLR